MKAESTKTKTRDSVDSLKLLASETRFKILTFLFSISHKACVKEIADNIGMSHSATSHQLAKLEDNGLLKSEREGQTICYQIKDCDEARRLISVINTLSS